MSIIDTNEVDLLYDIARAAGKWAIARQAVQCPRYGAPILEEAIALRTAEENLAVFAREWAEKHSATLPKPACRHAFDAGTDGVIIPRCLMCGDTIHAA